MTQSYDSLLRSSTRAWKFQRMELVLQYSSGSVWPHPFSVVAEPIVEGILHAIGGGWAARATSGSLKKMRIDLKAGTRNSEQIWASLYKNGKLEWEAFYKDDSCMAAMHQEVFHEVLPVLARRESPPPPPPPRDSDCNRLCQQANYMRKCADLVVRMTAKRNASSPGI